MKLVPTFTWQDTEGDEKKTQYQFEQHHIQVANSINGTIEDGSFFLRERKTAFTWVDGNPIYTKTLATSTWTSGGTVNTIATGITGNFTVIDMRACISNGALGISDTLLLPHVDVVGADSVAIVRNGTNIILLTSGASRAAFSGYVTISYIKS